MDLTARPETHSNLVRRPRQLRLTADNAAAAAHGIAIFVHSPTPPGSPAQPDHAAPRIFLPRFGVGHGLCDLWHAPHPGTPPQSLSRQHPLTRSNVLCAMLASSSVTTSVAVLALYSQAPVVPQETLARLAALAQASAAASMLAAGWAALHLAGQPLPRTPVQECFRLPCVTFLMGATLGNGAACGLGLALGQEVPPVAKAAVVLACGAAYATLTYRALHQEHIGGFALPAAHLGQAVPRHLRQ